MRGTIVGVLRGGPSREHEVSLNTGAAILRNLHPEHYTARDIYIDKEGLWHVHGKPSSPAEALRSIDVAVVGLHGDYGADGGVQKVLERYGVPYTGSDSFASYLSLHKVMAKEHAKKLGILTPEYRLVENEETMEEVLADVIRSFHQPVVVKPLRWGSSAHVVKVSGYAPLYEATIRLLRDGAGGVLIEEVIHGREASAGVVEQLRNENLYGLPIVETVADKTLCPAHFPKKSADEMTHIARAMHQELGLRDYSHSNFMVSPKGTYYLGTNAFPDLTSQATLPRALASVGVTFPDFLSHIIDRARTR
jgi:D-alanine-D-alanine ligase